MTRRIDAVYGGGVLRPLQSLEGLAEHAHVKLTIETNNAASNNTARKGVLHVLRAWIASFGELCWKYTSPMVLTLTVVVLILVLAPWPFAELPRVNRMAAFAAWLVLAVPLVASRCSLRFAAPFENTGAIAATLGALAVLIGADLAFLSAVNGIRNELLAHPEYQEYVNLKADWIALQIAHKLVYWFVLALIAWLSRQQMIRTGEFRVIHRPYWKLYTVVWLLAYVLLFLHAITMTFDIDAMW